MKPERAFGLVALILLSGCAGPVFRSQSPEEPEAEAQTEKVVGDLAVAAGMNPVKVEAVGLVAGLAGTGSDPEPSPLRSALLDEMQTRSVHSPNQLLASNNYAMVLVRGYLRPGIQKGDRFDVEIRVPSQSETTSIAGGKLMETRLSELAVLDRIREGDLLALADGPVLVDPSAAGGEDKVRLNRGLVLGGGVVLQSRPLGLVLKGDSKSVRNSQQIGIAVNRRFHSFADGVKDGVAKPMTDEFIELKVHPRYKDNIERYVKVVRSVALRETAAERAARLTVLERQLLEPVTASNAALRLEAIGQDAIPTLKKGIESRDPEVRFYAAEALAYLDDSSAAAPLTEAAKNQPAFRVFALTALSAMDDFAAEEGLRSLLDVPSAETRYGAFRSLWAMNPANPIVRGESVGGQFSYHVVASRGEPLVHVTKSRRPEIVLFGAEQRFITPMILDAGRQIMIDGRSGDRITVSRFAPNEPDQKRSVSTKVDDVIRAIVELGGTYPDVVAALQQAKESHSLVSRFEVDALPEAGRTYERGLAALEDQAIDGDDSKGEKLDGEKLDGNKLVVDNPAPGLFAKTKQSLDDDKPSESASEPIAETGKSRGIRGWFGRNKRQK